MKKAWYEREMTQGEQLHWQLGPLDLWARGRDDEWCIAVDRTDEDRGIAVDESQMPGDVEQRRWMTCSEGDRLCVAPVMPDRSLIVRPQSPVEVLPGSEVLFFMSIPVWIKVVIRSSRRPVIDLCEEHTVRLSNSWFGLPTEGELCYALRSRARRSLDEHQPAPHRVICPLLIRNEADTILAFERLCLYCRHLDIYQGDKHMWTNHVTLIQNRDGDLAKSDFGQDAPDYDNTKKQIGAARERPEKGFGVRAFDNFKAIGLL